MWMGFIVERNTNQYIHGFREVSKCHNFFLAITDLIFMDIKELKQLGNFVFCA